MEISTEISPDSHKYLRLAKYFRDQIHSGVLKPGERLPSFAQMQAKHGIGQGTLERAYALLEEERIIVREPKRGTFVAENKLHSFKGVIGVASGMPPKEIPYYRYLLEGIQDVAYHEKVEILLLHDVSTAKLEKMDGLITTGGAIRIPPTMPCVSLVRPGNAGHCVMADDYGGAKAATEHLITLGHRRIAFLVLGGHKASDPVIEQRIVGYRDALQAAGIKAERRWIRPLRDVWEELRAFSDLGYEKMKRWLQEDWTQLGCTAILAHNDDTAVGVIRAFEEAKIEVPGQVSVIGFDGTEVADLMQPCLTTVKVPLHEIGATGMRILLQQIGKTMEDDGDGGELKRQVLPTHLKIQDSTRAVSR